MNEKTNWTKVEIPQELIKALEKYGLKRFLKVKSPILNDPTSGKRGFETGMFENLYYPDDPDLLDWLEKGGNYGIAFGGIVAGLDLDNQELVDKAHKAGINTLEIQSGSGRGSHLIIITDLDENGTIDRWNPDKVSNNGKQGMMENLANIQYQRKLLVGPNSNHYSGNKYRIINDAPLQYVSKEQLKQIFGEELHWTSEKRQRAEEASKEDRTILGADIPIKKFINNWEDFHAMGKAGEWQGAHPIHGSSGGHNLSVNVDKNYWFCHRDNTGGGIISWVAVYLGLIDCTEVGVVPIDGSKFHKVVEYLKKMGFDLEIKDENKVSPTQAVMDLILAEDIELFYDQFHNAYIRATIKPSNAPPDKRDDVTMFSVPSYLDSQKEKKPDTASDSSENTQNIVTDHEISSHEKNIVTHTVNTLKHKTMSLKSSEVKQWIRYTLAWKKAHMNVSSETLKQVIDLLHGMALDEGKQYTLYNRVAVNEEGFWLDMTDDTGRAILITSEKWVIVDDPPILFKRYNHQRPLVEPDVEGDVEDAWHLLDYLNVDRQDEGNMLMVMTSIISYLIPEIPHPILVLSGPQGSAKSYMLRLIRKVIDPSSLELLQPCHSGDELALKLEHHWLAFFDNLTLLPAWASEIFCTAVTGGGISKRTLYTDIDETVLEYRRCIGLNGINVAAQKADLLDRSLIVTLPAIPEEKKIREKLLDKDFKRDLPKMLGGMLTVFSRAMRLYSQVHQRYYQRLADFHHWGIAITLALGRKQTDFNRAYMVKVEEQNREALNADNVAMVLLKYAEDDLAGTKWVGEPTELFETLKNKATALGIEIKSKSFPKAPNALMRRIKMAAVALNSVGVQVDVLRNRTKRLVVIDARELKDDELVGIKAEPDENVQKMLEKDDLEHFSDENHEKRDKNQQKLG